MVPIILRHMQVSTWGLLNSKYTWLVRVVCVICWPLHEHSSLMANAVLNVWRPKMWLLALE